MEENKGDRARNQVEFKAADVTSVISQRQQQSDTVESANVDQVISHRDGSEPEKE